MTADEERRWRAKAARYLLAILALSVVGLGGLVLLAAAVSAAPLGPCATLTTSSNAAAIRACKAYVAALPDAALAPPAPTVIRGAKLYEPVPRSTVTFDPAGVTRFLVFEGGDWGRYTGRATAGGAVLTARDGSHVVTVLPGLSGFLDGGGNVYSIADALARWQGLGAPPPTGPTAPPPPVTPPADTTTATAPPPADYPPELPAWNASEANRAAGWAAVQRVQADYAAGREPGERDLSAALSALRSHAWYRVMRAYPWGSRAWRQAWGYFVETDVASNGGVVEVDPGTRW